MAKYLDYVKNDQIDNELKEVKSRNIPDSVLKRFDGKSVEDVLESYAELQRMSSQQGEELGALRKTVGDLVSLQSQSTASVADSNSAVEPVTIDNLYEDPEGTIAKVADKQSSKRIKELEDQVTAMAVRDRRAALTQRYPDWETDVKSPEFVEWVKSSNARVRLAVAGDRGDFDSASDLLELWNSHTKKEQEVQRQVARERQFRDASLETSSPGSVDVPESFSRSELQEKRIRAKRGDQVAQRWLQAHAEAIAIAYEEGRLTA